MHPVPVPFRLGLAETRLPVSAGHDLRDPRLPALPLSRKLSSHHLGNEPPQFIPLWR